MLSVATAPPYDYREGEMTEGGMVDASRPGYRQVAAKLREQILSGEIPAGSVLKSHTALSAEHGDVSPATINAAVAALAAEGLVRVEHGKPTLVLDRHRYHAEARVRWSGPELDYGRPMAAAERVATAEGAAFSVHGLDAFIEIDVETADPAQAVARVWAISRAACSVAGWDLAGASVSARPA